MKINRWEEDQFMSALVELEAHHLIWAWFQSCVTYEALDPIKHVVCTDQCFVFRWVTNMWLCLSVCSCVILIWSVPGFKALGIIEAYNPARWPIWKSTQMMPYHFVLCPTAFTVSWFVLFITMRWTISTNIKKNNNNKKSMITMVKYLSPEPKHFHKANV